MLQEEALADLLQDVQHIGNHAIYPHENPFSTDGTRDVPDGYAAATSGAYRPHLAVQEFQTRYEAWPECSPKCSLGGSQKEQIQFRAGHSRRGVSCFSLGRTLTALGKQSSPLDI